MASKKKTLIVDALDKHIDDSNKPYIHKNKEPRFIPSGLGTPCLRKLFYIYSKVPQDNDVPVMVKKAGLVGNVYHDKLADLLREMNVLIDYYDEDGNQLKDPNGNIDLEFPIKAPDLKIKGKIDLVLKLKDKIWLGEMKSSTTKSFEYLKRMKKPAPKSQHLPQGLIYLYIFTQMLKDGEFKHIKELEGIKEVEGIIFIYINKDNHEFLEIPIKRNDKEFIKIVQKMKTVEAYYEQKQLPPGTSDFCNSCPWHSKCVKNKLS